MSQTTERLEHPPPREQKGSRAAEARARGFGSVTEMQNYEARIEGKCRAILYMPVSDELIQLLLRQGWLSEYGQDSPNNISHALGHFIQAAMRDPHAANAISKLTYGT